MFEVAVELEGTDPTLRPSMTTSNKIVAQVIADALHIPLECLHSEADSITFVYKKDGIATVKQEVIVGETNANDVVITGGLQESDRLFLSVPAGAADEDVKLLPDMNGKRQKKGETKDATPGPLASTKN